MKAKYRILEGKAGVRDLYDQMADRYNRSRYLYWTRKFEAGEERAIGEWIENLRSPVLDVGCGTGRYVIRKAMRGSVVVGLDISRKMLEKTFEEAKKYDYHRIVYPVLGDGEYLPFRDGSFNGLICTLTFDHFTNPEGAVYEFSRVLKGGGFCVLTTFNSYTLDDFRKRHKLPLDKVSFQTEDIPPTLVYEVGYSADEIRNLFTKYGFSITDVKGCCYWHLLPLGLARYYKSEFDSIFNIFKPLLKYAEMHAA